jgi:hypothetical protein
MSQTPPSQALEKIEKQQVIWFASVRPDGRPHLSPIWFVWHAGRFYVSTDPRSVKSRNIRGNGRVVLALEDGVNPVICEGAARVLDPPWPAELLAAFFQKYEWDLNKEEQYNQVIEVTPLKWLAW